MIQCNVFNQIARKFLLMAKMPRVNQYFLCNYFLNRIFAPIKEKDHSTISNVSHLTPHTHIK